MQDGDLQLLCPRTIRDFLQMPEATNKHTLILNSRQRGTRPTSSGDVDKKEKQRGKEEGGRGVHKSQPPSHLASLQISGSKQQLVDLRFLNSPSSSIFESISVSFFSEIEVIGLGWGKLQTTERHCGLCQIQTVFSKSLRITCEVGHQVPCSRALQQHLPQRKEASVALPSLNLLWVCVKLPTSTFKIR